MNQDKGMALFKIERIQEDSGISNLDICGWIVFALCMALLAIPAIRAIMKVIKVCNNCTEQYSLDTKISEDQEDLETEGKYKAVSYVPPSLTENKDMTFNPKTINSMTRNQERLDKEIKFLEKDKESKNDK